MDISELTESVVKASEVLRLAVPYIVGLAGVFGLGTLVFFSFIRQH